MSNRELLMKTIELAEKRDEEEKELEKRHGIDRGEQSETGAKTMVLDLKKGDEADYVNAPRPRAAELESFLKGLSDQDILYIAAVMSGGKDYWVYKESPQGLDVVIEELKSDHPDNVRELIHTILEEEPLAQYLRAGIAFYQIAEGT
jgi:hypothetical protein